jgi:hypothetical protein
VFLSGHVENLAAAVTANKLGLSFVSEGTGTNAAKFTCATTGGCFVISQGGILLSGLYFPASTTTATNARVDVTTTAPTDIENCYFEMGALDTTAAIRWGSGGVSTGLSLDGVSFVANGATQAAIGLSIVTNASSVMDITNMTCDGGTIGFSDFVVKLGVAVTAIDARAVNQLNNAHISLAAGCTGTWIPGTVSGGSRFEQA